MPNNALKTPFYMLLKKQTDLEDQKELVNYFLDNCEIDFHTYKGQEMVKMMETQNPDCKIPRTLKVVNFDFMMTLLDNRKELDFEIFFKAFKDNVGEETFTDHCLRFLEIGVANGMKDTVEFLLDKRVDVNERSSEAKYLKPPAFLACANGYSKILELLLKKPELEFQYQKEKQKYTLLHEICQNFATKMKDNRNVDFQRCFDLVLKDSRCDPNAEDDLGCSPLHYTVRYKNDASTIALLKKGAYINEESNFGKTPIDEISRATFQKFLDECITTSVRTDKKIQDIQIDYNFLIAPNRNRDVDSADKDGFCKEISSLKRISDNEELRSLVNHPVLSSFLFLKWSKLSFLFYTNLFMFSIFMAAFIYFIVLCQYLKVEERDDNYLYIFLEKVSFLSIWMLMIREAFQCILSYKHYFLNIINWFEMCLIILSWTVYTSISNFEDKNQRILRAVLILGAAFEFLQIVGTLPFLSVSTHMVILKRVSITFLKSIALYSILLLSFGLSFFMLFGGNESDDESIKNKRSATNATDCCATCNTEEDSSFKNFQNPGIAIVRTFVMLTGEFDATDMKLDSGAICLIFTLFVFLVTIVLFNLLNALAVSDTQAIKAKGETIDLIQRIHVLDSYERIIFNRNSKMTSRTGPWLRSFISLFPNIIPNGKIIIRPSRNNEILTFRPNQTARNLNSSQAELEGISNRSFRRITINEQLLARLQKYSQMSASILKKIRNILAEKEEQKAIEFNDRKMRDDITSIKSQMDNQTRLINELLSKHKSP